MSQKNLNASSKTHSFLLNKLKDKKISQIYNKFEKELGLNDDFIVAVSGGPDSLALSFLSMIYSIKKRVKVKYFLVDHKLRKNSTEEARFVKKLFQKFKTNLIILNWNGIKPKTNTQSIAREKRYNLLIRKAKKLKINNILLGHQKEDLFENFFIRLLRGTGLNGMVSFDKKSQIKKINLIRPLLNFSKKDLEKISKTVFSTYIQDPTNLNEQYKRVKIRNFIAKLQSEGFNFKKFNLTLNNLKFANETINFFTQKNLDDNSVKGNKNNSVLLNKEFFNQPKEIVFRSFTEVLKIVGKRFYPSRGRKIVRVLDQVKNDSLIKTTLGNCVIKKVNQTIIVSKEH